jgi:hypothetical protein
VRPRRPANRRNTPPTPLAGGILGSGLTYSGRLDHPMCQTTNQTKANAVKRQRVLCAVPTRPMHRNGRTTPNPSHQNMAEGFRELPDRDPLSYLRHGHFRIPEPTRTYNLSAGATDVTRELQALGAEDTSLDHLRITLQKYLNKTEYLAHDIHPFGHPVQHAALSLWVVALIIAAAYTLWKCRSRMCKGPTTTSSRTNETSSVIAPPRRRQPPRALTFEMRDMHEVTDLTSPST